MDLILNCCLISGQSYRGGFPVEPRASHGQQEQLHPDLLRPRQHLQPPGVRHQSLAPAHKYDHYFSPDYCHLHVFPEEWRLVPRLSKCLFHPVTMTKPGSGAASLCSNRILPSFWILFLWPHWRKLNCSQKSQNVRYFLPERPLTVSLGP